VEVDPVEVRAERIEPVPGIGKRLARLEGQGMLVHTTCSHEV
jgi:hypothetical protein